MMGLQLVLLGGGVVGGIIARLLRGRRLLLRDSGALIVCVVLSSQARVRDTV
jgi:hypothetical protein